MAAPVCVRKNPLRKPKGFEPAVQRWSVALPGKYSAYTVMFFGVQGRNAGRIAASPFQQWIRTAFDRPDGPVVRDHARYTDPDGTINHLVAGYWIDEANLASWSAAPEVGSWWDDPARVTEECGYFREIMHVPLERQETLYWQDYPVGLSRSDEVAIYPTPYCGYYGAMRDRLPLAAVYGFESPAGAERLVRRERPTRGARWRVYPPENLAVIRSGTYWGRCDAEQYEDFMTNLRGPLERGMQYLRENAEESGCCSLRYQQTCDAAGEPAPAAHALGYFLSLPHLENWAEHHASHHAIFSSAIARYRKYGAANQLRTWHEVYVLPKDGHLFEYVNCTPATGLLPWFEAERR